MQTLARQRAYGPIIQMKFLSCQIYHTTNFKFNSKENIPGKIIGATVLEL